MAEKINIDLDLKTGSAIKDTSKIADNIQDIGKASKQTEKGVKKFSTTLGNIGKATGVVALVVKAFEILQETFNKNQKVVDIFNTGMEVLSLAFNDLFSFLSNNVGNVIGWFQGIFSDPVGAIKDFGNAIKDNLIERFNSFLDTLGFVASAVKKVFSGDFAGALEDVKSAGKESLDVLTGVDNTFEKTTETVKNIIPSIKEYTKSTLSSATAIVKANKAAQIGIAQNRIILEQKDREAEKLRQIRDDESKTIEERIKANDDLAKVLQEQEDLMTANADALIRAAQLQYEKNASDENYIALLDAKAEKEGILAQVEGFRSEQLTNQISLQKELTERTGEEAELQIETQKLKQQAIQDTLDAVIGAAGAETKVGKALFLFKQGMIIKEQIMAAQATMGKILSKAAEATVDGATGFMKAAAAAPPPANIPLIAIFAAQAAGIAMSIKSAVNAAKGIVGKSGGVASGGGGSTGAPSAPAAPAFNVVGAAPENQLAEAIGEDNKKPTKAYVVSQEVSNAQALNRNIVEGASIG